MRRLVANLLLIGLLASYLIAAALPVSANAETEQCWQTSFIYRNNTSAPGTVFVDLHDNSPQTAYHSFTYTLQPGELKTVTVVGRFPIASSSFTSSAISTTLTFVGFGTFSRVAFSVCSTLAHIDDGRINAYDLGAPLAAYCTPDNGIAVWDIDDAGQGTLGFTATADEIASALSDAVSSGQNQLIAQGLGNSLYALSSNEVQLVGPDIHEPGKTYDFIAAGNVCG